MRLTDLIASRKLEGRIDFQGLSISIENAKGSVRQGVDKVTGKPWKVKMTYPYGYIRMSKGVDGDHVDCFVGPNPDAEDAYVIHTNNPHTGKYDEDKVFLGFNSGEAAKKAFLKNYSSADFFGSLETVTMATFKEKVLGTLQRPAKIAAKGWRLGQVLELNAGGIGSGCNPEAGKCGRPTGRKPTANGLVQRHKAIEAETILESINKTPGVQFRLVGSVAKGKAKADSDIDVHARVTDESIVDWEKGIRLLKKLGYEYEGSSKVSPDESRSYGKQVHKGWSTIEQFRHRHTNQVLDVWWDDD